MNKLIAQNNLEKLTKKIAEMVDRVNEDFPERQIWEYGSFERVILEHGRNAEAKPRPENIKQGIPMRCYYNCQQLVLTNPNLTYIEGYAAPSQFESVVPISHAWVLDSKDGMIIDPTWEPFGLCYLGVAFSTAWLKLVWETRERKDCDYEVTIFQGNYLDDFWILKEGFPAGALVQLT